MKRSPMHRSTIPMRRTPMKRTQNPMARHTPLIWRGRRKERRVGKYTGRVVLGALEYTALCWRVWQRDGGQCMIHHNFPATCWGRLPNFSKRFIDHIIKRSQGGGDTLENLRLACPPCHDWADNKGGKRE
jgi:5-methylcytosine-specific restriction endonuclease McrA